MYPTTEKGDLKTFNLS